MIRLNIVRNQISSSPAPEWQDDPKKDYRVRYRLPEHWVLNDESPFALDYAGYIEAILSLVSDASTFGGSRPRALDAGCGDGFVTRRLVDRGYDVHGVDYNRRAVGFARVFVEEARFDCMDLRELDRHPEFCGVFDLVISVEVIEHLPTQYQSLLLRHLVWTMKPDARLIISVPSVFIRASGMHYKHFTLEEITAMLREAGLVVEETVYQHRLSLLDSRRVWKLVRNKTYDLVCLRRFMKWIFVNRYNLARSDERVGRYILRCHRHR